MKLEMLKNTPSWEWPADAGDTLLGVLRNSEALDSELLLASELAGDVTVISDELVGALLSIAT
ncbi:MAG TPA: hypothetical protein VGP93_10810, partial [Polyangiaceae bacterium]|nr:hypothetical protein [Polyangiaceae bacterium]